MSPGYCVAFVVWCVALPLLLWWAAATGQTTILVVVLLHLVWTPIQVQISSVLRHRSMERAHRKTLDEFRATHGFLIHEARAIELETLVDALHVLPARGTLAPEAVAATLEDRIKSLREVSPSPPLIRIQELLRGEHDETDAAPAP